MTKKEFMLKVIDSLPDWKMGWGLKALIQNDQLSSDAFEKLYEVFKNSVHQTYNDVQKQQMQQRMNQVNAMKQQESQQQEENSANLDAMFSIL
jgi:thymidylate kinase